MKTSKYLQIAILLIAGMVIGALAVTQLGWLPPTHAKYSESSEPAAPAPTYTPKYDSSIIRDLNGAFIAIAEKAKPSVVTIFTDKVVKQQGPFAGPFQNDPFRNFLGDDFFGRFFGQGNPPEREQHLRGMGSGVIVSADGYILTNNHVVGGSDKIQVMLYDGKKVDARVVGTDAKTDIAVIKVDKDGLTPIELGDSEQLRVGEWVMAIGSPLSENLAHTVTSGIVSAKGRSNVGLADYEDFIQTDAAINPGNSGGALVNLDGQLVGINTAIATQNGGFQGIGFAVPVNMARKVMNALIKNGKVVRGYIGVNIQNLDESMAQAMHLPGTGGALIADVVEDGPAAKAGLKVEDVIVEMNGNKVKDITQLRNDIASLAPGTRVTFKIVRNGSEKTVDVTLGELPADQSTPEMQQSNAEKLGFTVQTLDERLAAQLGYDRNERGVVITRIDSDSEAAANGLRQGDLIKQINRQPVITVSEFNRIVGRMKSGDTVLVYAKRQNSNFFTAFQLP